MSDKPELHLLFGPREPAGFLYHYTAAETFADYIGPSLTLRLNPFDKMNDPRECDRWDFDWFNPKGDDFFQGRELLNDIIRAQARLACFCLDETLPAGDHTYFDVAYSRGFSRPRMWAQYAANHSGVCIVFDRHRLVANFEAHMKKNKLRMLVGIVDYANRVPVGSIGRDDAFTVMGDEYRSFGAKQYALRHVLKHHRELFFQKHLDWRDENEYRVILYGKSPVDVLVPISGSTMHVVLGSKCSGALRQRVIDECCRINVDASYLKWKNGYPEPMPLVIDGRQRFL